MPSVQPFYFMASLWGERYRDYFVDRCLPTLLAPGNFPALRAGDGHRLLVATTKADWQAMANLPVMDTICEYLTPEFVEVGLPDTTDAAPGGEVVIRHHAKCQKQLCALAFRDRAYGSVVFPDTLYSTGAVSSLLDYARAGHRLVLCAALRQSEEGVLAELAATGVLPTGAKPSLVGEPISIAPRTMVDLAIRHLHPEVVIYDWDYPGAPVLAAHRFWRVAGGRGLILRTFFGVPVLMDYRSIDVHDTECLERDIFENVYVRANFAKGGGLHVVQDSDDFMLISLTADAIGHRYVPRRLPGSPWLRELDRECGLRASMHYFVGRTDDGLKGALFNSPMRWHTDDLDGAWKQREREVSVLTTRMIGDYGPARQADAVRFPRRLSARPRRFLADVSPNLINRICVVADAVKGRQEARSRIMAAIANRIENWRR